MEFCKRKRLYGLKIVISLTEEMGELYGYPVMPFMHHNIVQVS